MQLYYWAALGKCVLWALILLIDYTSINVYEDPTVGIGLWFLWMFILSRGASFFLFLWVQKLYRQIEKDRLVKDSYKLSLLFGIFVMINILLLLLWYRNKIIGLALLLGFVALQITLFSDSKASHDHKQ